MAIFAIDLQHKAPFGLAVHQFGHNVGNMLRLTRRDRYVVDHLNASVAKRFQ